ncbi:endonuclease/exonuclease/phosphatase family protein [Nonomuraea sp. NPDC049637]|uniref:endonuclease/exonuclease/phosphatase family protein n=1 Tax=Nonomuraea sp. NPDC049637 TaxID=3154356 RepID=UPI0034359DCF
MAPSSGTPGMRDGVLVRVASYNVRSMRDDVPALRRVLAAMRADLVCVQEAPRFARWRARRRALAEAGGLRVATPGRAGGVCVLAGPRARVLEARLHRLKAFPGLERRVLAVAVVEIGGARLAVGSLHLDLHLAARLRHAGEAMSLMERAAAAHDAAVVVGADVNERGHQPAWRFLAARLSDCHAVAPAGDGLTFPAARPAERIDAVFAAREACVLSCGGVAAGNADLAGASDHLPVLAELQVGL